MDSLSRSIFGLSQPKDFNINSDKNINDAETSMLDQNIINALEDNFIRLDTETEVSVEGEDEECATVGNNNINTAKLKKIDIHPSSILDVTKVGTEKMKKIISPVVRHRRSKRLANEKKAVRDSIYNSLFNTDRIRPIDIVIDKLSEDDTGALFAQCDIAMNKLV